MLDIERLIAVDDPAWPHLQQALAESDVIALPVDPERGQRSLWGLQVSAASTMGAVALHTGGIVADHGWVRLYGGGSEHLLSIAEANGLSGPVPEPPGALDGVFEGLRWPGWQGEVAPLALSQGIALYPPPSTVEGSDVSKASRSVVSIQELLGTA